jgi:hypothetical protein
MDKTCLVHPCPGVRVMIHTVIHTHHPHLSFDIFIFHRMLVMRHPASMLSLSLSVSVSLFLSVCLSLIPSPETSYRGLVHADAQFTITCVCPLVKATLSDKESRMNASSTTLRSNQLTHDSLLPTVSPLLASSSGMRQAYSHVFNHSVFKFSVCPLQMRTKLLIRGLFKVQTLIRNPVLINKTVINRDHLSSWLIVGNLGQGTRC